MISKDIQTDPSQYFNGYDKPLRWLSYKTQCELAVKFGKKNVLEIGVGNKTVSSYMKERGLNVTLFDFDPRLKPDITGDVRALPFKNGSFDTVVCFEVLEHLPFESVGGVLQDLKDISSEYVVVSVPHFYGIFMELAFKIPGFERKTLQLKIPFPVKHKVKRQHYWELGKRGFSAGRLKSLFSRAGFTLVTEKMLSSESFHRVMFGLSGFIELHHFFVLRKKV